LQREKAVANGPQNWGQPNPQVNCDRYHHTQASSNQYL